MLILDMSLQSSDFKAVIFPKTLEKTGKNFDLKRLYIIEGKLEKDNRDEDSFSITNIIELPKFR